MSQPDAEDRERAVQSITERNVIQKRIARTQKKIAALPDSVEREALLQSLAADQTALAEMSQAFEKIKAEMLQELVDSLRRNNHEAQRLHDEWKSRQFSHSFLSGSVPPSDSQMFGFFLIIGVIFLGMLILLR